MTSRLTRSQSLKKADDGQSDSNENSSVDESPRNVANQSKIMTLDDIQTYFDSKFNQLFEDMATKSCLEKLLNVIDGQRKRIDELESKVSVMNSLITQLKHNADDQEQYQRRLCLRINGIPAPQVGQVESGEECFEKVKMVFKDQLELDIPDVAIDRAHRIGSTKVIAGRRYRQVIVRFTTWRHRTQVYRARKKAQSHRIKLDLTHARSEAIQNANILLKSKGNNYFAFADINCRVCAKLGEEFYYFSDQNDLIRKLGSIEHSTNLNTSITSEIETF